MPLIPALGKQIFVSSRIAKIAQEKPFLKKQNKKKNLKAKELNLMDACECSSLVWCITGDLYY